MVDNSTILNAVWLNGTWDYQQRVPAPDVATQRQQLEAIFAPNNGRIFNEFVDTLVQRIGMTIVRQQSWRNPLSPFKASLPFGGSVQEIATKWIKAHSYSMDAQTLLKLHAPEMEVAYHSTNRADTYPISINRALLQQAVVDESGINRLIDSVLQAPINSANYDEYLQTVNLLAFYEATWGFFKVSMAEPDDEATSRAFLKKLKALVNRLAFPSSLYNAGVITDIPVFARPEELVLFVSPEAAAAVDVDGLAVLFHLEPTDAKVRRIIIDQWPIDGAYALLTTTDFFQIYDQVYENGSFYNPETLSTNYFLNVQQIISCSPFVPAILFTTAEGTTTPTITQTVTTNQVVDPVWMQRYKNGNMAPIASGTKLTRDMVTGKNPDDEYDGVFLYGKLDGTLSDGTLSGVEEIGGISVKPDAYIATGFTYSGTGMPAAANARTYIDRVGRLHLQAGAYKGDGTGTLSMTLLPTYVNPSGETPAATPTTTTIALEAGPNFNPGPVPPTPVGPGPLSQYVSRISVLNYDGRMSVSASGVALDADVIVLLGPTSNPTIDYSPAKIMAVAVDETSMTTDSTYSMSWIADGSPHASSTQNFVQNGTTFDGSVASIVVPDDGSYVDFPLSIVTPDGTITTTARVTYQSGN